MPLSRLFPLLAAVSLVAGLWTPMGCGGGCPTGQQTCGGTCTDTAVDVENCGTCATVCPAGQLCSKGACSETCAAGYTVCSSGSSAHCADLNSDSNNCGACGKVCGAGEACNGSGSCKATCGAGQCGTACPAGSTLCMPAGGVAYCANFQKDPNNCGGCATVCTFGQVCAAGTCSPMPSPPQVVSAGGPVLSTPVFVPIFFSNDSDSSAPVSQIEMFYENIGASAYWQATAAYGVGAPASPVTPVNLTEAAPTMIDDTYADGGSPLTDWLLNDINAGKIPQPQAQTIYAIHYPLTTTVTADGTTSCTDFGGYHSDIQTATALISYAVMPRCTMMGQSDLAVLTETASHELVEASTDPYPDYAPAYSEVDSDHIFWDEGDSGSEIADQCENDPEAYVQFSDFPFVVQRFWSNAAANQGHDPCVPEYTGGVYFNAVPVLPDTVAFNYGGEPLETEGVNIAVGSSKTIPLYLYSDDPTAGSWDVAVYDFSQYYLGGSALLTFSLSSSSGGNGDVINLTITVAAAGSACANGEVDNTELFLVVSSQGSGNNQTAHQWWGLVGN
jgi:hypothetical protein